MLRAMRLRQPFAPRAQGTEQKVLPVTGVIHYYPLIGGRETHPDFSPEAQEAARAARGGVGGYPAAPSDGRARAKSSVQDMQNPISLDGNPNDEHDETMRALEDVFNVSATCGPVVGWRVVELTQCRCSTASGTVV
jgi:hypothetical protein